MELENGARAPTYAHLWLSCWEFKSPGNQMSKTGCSVNGKLTLSLSLSIIWRLESTYMEGCNGIN
jgi:hypothetical protein